MHADQKLFPGAMTAKYIRFGKAIGKRILLYLKKVETSNQMVTTKFNSRFIRNPLDCPVTRAMSIIGGKWKPIILNCIGDRVMRYGKLKQIIPAISGKVLSNELKELEMFGLITRRKFTGISPRVEYALTDAGKTLLPILFELEVWGNTHIAKKIIEDFS
ncbi:MAG: winged helix-turn-helix transcriptional regulator [Saprospiraceae bacterium]